MSGIEPFCGTYFNIEAHRVDRMLCSTVFSLLFHQESRPAGQWWLCDWHLERSSRDGWSGRSESVSYREWQSDGEGREGKEGGIVSDTVSPTLCLAAGPELLVAGQSVLDGDRAAEWSESLTEIDGSWRRRSSSNCQLPRWRCVSQCPVQATLSRRVCRGQVSERNALNDGRLACT